MLKEAIKTDIVDYFKDNTINYYNEFVDFYDLTYDNWDDTLKEHGKIVDSILQKYAPNGKARRTVLDCTCGIGTQAIGLALCGGDKYEITGSDISDREIEKAKRESVRLGADIKLKVADVRSLSDHFSQKFDIIMSFDNAVVHLDDIGLSDALYSIRSNFK